MSKTIRNRAIVLFFLLLFSSVFFYFWQNWHYESALREIKGVFTQNRIHPLIQRILDEVEEGENKISFSSQLKEELKKEDMEAYVVDEKGLILAKTIESGENTALNLEEVLGEENRYDPSRKGKITLSYPLLKNGVQVGNILIMGSVETIFQGLKEKPDRAYSLGTGVFLILFLSLVLWLLIWIQKSILHPVRFLSERARRIPKGDWHTPISYPKEDEVGDFYRTMDYMRLEMKYLWEMEQLQRKAHQDLIACVSHDLRTPLSSVKAYVEGLQDGVAETEEMKKKYLQVIYQKTEELTWRIQELLQYSLEEVGEFHVNCKDCYSDQWLGELLDTLEGQLQEQNRKIILPKELPRVMICVDAVRMEQVLWNLLENAVKYTKEKGEIKISCYLEKQHLCISVADTGYGIPEEDKAYIFQRYFRSQMVKELKKQGSGLGLSICKQIVEKHGGTIQFESTLGKGSNFMIHLPMH